MNDNTSIQHAIGTATQHPEDADPLLEACTSGNTDTLRELLLQPAMAQAALSWEVRVTFDDPKSDVHIEESILNLHFMLQKAAGTGHAAIMRQLFEFARDNSVDIKTIIEHETVEATIKSNSTDALQVLIDVDPSVVSYHMGHGGDPLTRAVCGDKENLVALLLERGADPNRDCWVSHLGKPGFYLYNAAWFASFRVVELLLQHGAKVPQSGALHKAAEKGRLDVMRLLVTNGADVNEQLEIWGVSRRGLEMLETPLHVAVLNSQREAAAWLVEHGADVSIQDKEGSTAVDIAHSVGTSDMVETLSAGARNTCAV